MPRCPVMSKARVSFPAGGDWSEGRKPLGLSGCRRCLVREPLSLPRGSRRSEGTRLAREPAGVPGGGAGAARLASGKGWLPVAQQLLVSFPTALIGGDFQSQLIYKAKQSSLWDTAISIVEEGTIPRAARISKSKHRRPLKPEFQVSSNFLALYPKCRTSHTYAKKVIHVSDIQILLGTPCLIGNPVQAQQTQGRAARPWTRYLPSQPAASTGQRPRSLSQKGERPSEELTKLQPSFR